MDPLEKKLAEPVLNLPAESIILPSLESVSKVAASGAVLIYLCGFLVTTSEYSRFGFIESNPLRPHLIAAGVWLIIFLLIGAFSASSFIRLKVATDFDSDWVIDISRLFSHWVTSISAACLFSTFFHSGISSLRLGLIVLLSLSVWAPLRYSATKYKFARVVLPTLECTLMTGTTLSAVYNLIKHRVFSADSLYLWFFVVGIVILYELSNRRWKTQIGNIPQTIVNFLALAVLFGSIYYPHLSSSVGGGESLPITITFV